MDSRKDKAKRKPGGNWQWGNWHVLSCPAPLHRTPFFACIVVFFVCIRCPLSGTEKQTKVFIRVVHFCSWFRVWGLV